MPPREIVSCVFLKVLTFETYIEVKIHKVFCYTYSNIDDIRTVIEHHKVLFRNKFKQSWNLP